MQFLKPLAPAMKGYFSTWPADCTRQCLTYQKRPTVLDGYIRGNTQCGTTRLITHLR